MSSDARNDDRRTVERIARSFLFFAFDKLVQLFLPSSDGNDMNAFLNKLLCERLANASVYISADRICCTESTNEIAPRTRTLRYGKPLMLQWSMAVTEQSTKIDVCDDDTDSRNGGIHYARSQEPSEAETARDRATEAD